MMWRLWASAEFDVTVFRSISKLCIWYLSLTHRQAKSILSGNTIAGCVRYAFAAQVFHGKSEISTQYHRNGKCLVSESLQTNGTKWNLKSTPKAQATQRIARPWKTWIGRGTAWVENNPKDLKCHHGHVSNTTDALSPPSKECQHSLIKRSIATWSHWDA